LEISGGTRTLLSQLTAATLTLSGGILAKGTQTLTVNGGLTMSGGDLTSTAGDVIITGAVNISSALSAISFGSETWTVSGTWTNASTDDTSWSAGTGTVLFDSATGGTMAFAGSNLTGPEFNNVTFSSSAGTAQVFTMATRGLQWAGTLSIFDTSSTTELATSDLSLGTGGLNVGDGGILTSNASTVTLSSVTMVGGTSGIITVTTGSWTVSGNWDTSGLGSIYTEGTGIVTFDATATVTMLSADNVFDDLTISGGTVTLGSSIAVTNTLTVSGGTLAKSTFVLTSIGSLTLSGGNLTSISGDVTITGSVSITSASSAIAFGSETWTVSGTWSNGNSTNAAVWNAGTGSIIFDSATGGTMTFAGSNLGEAEFNNVTFTSSAGTAQTFTMSTRGLIISGTLTITDASSTTTLATQGLSINADILTVGTGGILTAGASVITVSGNWDSTNGIFNEDTSTVVLSSTGTINSDTFYTLRITGGTRTPGGNITTTTFEITGGTYEAGANSIVFVTLDINGGTLTMDGLNVVELQISTNLGTIELTDWNTFDKTTTGEEDIAWVFNPSDPGAAVTFTIRALTVATDYTISRDSIDMETATSDNNGTVTFIITSGWSPHTMRVLGLGAVAGGGGGIVGGKEEPILPPILSFQTILIVLAIGLILMSLLDHGLRKKRQRPPRRR
jgi:hypothetical protein